MGPDHLGLPSVAILRLLLAATAVAIGALMPGPTQAQTQTQPQSQTLTHVSVPSLDRGADGHVLRMPSLWFEAVIAPTPSPVAAASAVVSAPAMVLLHGCGGPYASGGGSAQPWSTRMREYASRLNALGVHVLVTDSLTPRGETELCTQAIGKRHVNQRERRLDALGAMQWLALQPNVKKDNIGLIGWSHGGSAVLAATDAGHPDVKAAPVRASLAVAFYPGCAAALASGHRADAPLLMLVGDADDWTPSQPCKDLASKQSRVQLITYPGAYHGFDSKAPVRVRRDVPNGVNPGQGVHVGGQETARLDAERQLAAFLQMHWALAKP